MEHALKCGPCLFVEETVDPKHFCVDCLEYLCTGCARDHRKHKTLRGHTLLEETDLPQDITLFEEFKKLSHCLIHTDVELDQYCKNHGVLICIHCLKNEHRSCEDFIDLTTLLEQRFATENLGELIIKLKRKCEVQLTETMELSEAARTNSKEVEHYINTYVETLRKNVDNIGKKLNETRESLLSHVTESVRHSEETLSNIEKKTLRYENLLAVASKFGSTTHNITLHLLVSKLMKELEADYLHKKNSTVKIKCVQTVSTEEIVSRMGQCDVVLACTEEKGSELCNDGAVDEDSLRFTVSKTRTVATQVEEQVDSNTKISKKSLHEMKIMYGTIKLLLCECHYDFIIYPAVIALEVLTDGRILLLHEGKIKVYSLKMVLVSEFDFTPCYYAKDMCVLEDKEDGVFTVAICLNKFTQRHTISLMEYADKFCEKHCIDCSHTINSITLLGHHLLVVGDGPIQLLDISTGHVCYALDENIWASNGSNINTTINKIRACKTTKKIALACSDTVYNVNIEDGECQEDTLHAVCPFVWKYAHSHKSQPELKCNEDVKWDSQGNMYIATGRGVYQFCLINGNFKERALITMCENCSAIAIDEQRNRIVVGHSNSNRVHVYEYTLPAED